MLTSAIQLSVPSHPDTHCLCVWELLIFHAQDGLWGARDHRACGWHNLLTQRWVTSHGRIHTGHIKLPLVCYTSPSFLTAMKVHYLFCARLILSPQADSRDIQGDKVTHTSKISKKLICVSEVSKADIQHLWSSLDFNIFVVRRIQINHALQKTSIVSQHPGKSYTTGYC